MKDTNVLDNGAFSGEELSIAMLRNSPDCIKILNASGRIGFMSENGLCAMEITDVKDVAGKTWWDLWPEDQREALKGTFEVALAGQTAIHHGMCPTAAGTPKEWEVRVSPIRNEDGTISSILAVSRDVTAV